MGQTAERGVPAPRTRQVKTASAETAGLEEHGVDGRTVGEQAHQVELAASERDTGGRARSWLHHETWPGVVVRDQHTLGTGQEVRNLGRGAHPSSPATCSNQRTKGGGSYTPPTSTRARWANRGT